MWSESRPNHTAFPSSLLMVNALSGVYRHYLFQETEGFKLEQLTEVNWNSFFKINLVYFSVTTQTSCAQAQEFFFFISEVISSEYMVVTGVD